MLLTTVTHLQLPSSGLQPSSLCFCWLDISERPSIVCQRGTDINKEMEISQTYLSESQISGEKLDPINN